MVKPLLRLSVPAFLLAVFALGAVAAPARLLAWGPIGHRAVGQVAENHLTAKTRRAVAKLLDDATLADVSDWADEIRYLPEWKKADPWHYISIDDTETLMSTVRNPAGDVVEAIGRMQATLRDPKASAEERAVALKFLVHFVADIHQPLHVGRRADAGGNKIEVTMNGVKTNLHWLWDGILINDMGLSYTELARAIDHTTPAQVRTWQASSVADWANDSFVLRPRVYEIPEDGKLNYIYGFAHRAIVREQLLKAGIRLAGVLNSIFDPRHH